MKTFATPGNRCRRSFNTRSASSDSSSALCPAEGVMAIAQEMNGGAATEAVAALKARARQHGDDTAALSKIVEQRAEHLVEKWHAQVKDATAEYTYSRYDRKKKGKKLLSPLGDKRSDDDAPDFPAPTSMRDVEPSIAVWVRRRPRENEGKG